MVDESLTRQQQTFWLAEQARQSLPDDSYLEKMVDFIKQSYVHNPNKNDWEKTAMKFIKGISQPAVMVMFIMIPLKEALTLS